MNFLLFTDPISMASSAAGSDLWKFVIMAIVGTLSTSFYMEMKEYYAKRKEKRDSEKEKDNIDSTLRFNDGIQRSIKDILIQIQGYTECSRACLYNYHNGTKTHYGYSLNFISMVEEKTDGIVVPLIETFQKVPAAMYRPILNMIDESENGYVCIDRGRLDSEDRILLDKYQATTNYMFKLGNSVWEGVVGLSWVNKVTTLSDFEIEHVQELVNTISDLQRKLIKPIN